MAGGKRIIEAFASSGIKFKITRLNWTKHFFPGLADLSFSFEYNGKKFLGRGTDRDEEVALIKAAVECIERCVCSYHKLHTNGIAAHFDLELAKSNARQELIERDSALCHYLTQTPPNRIGVGTNHAVERALNLFRAHGVEFIILKLENFGNVFPVMVVAFGENAQPRFGMIVGLGCKQNVEDSIESAFIECSRNVAFVLNSEHLDVLNEKTFAIAEKMPYSHFQLALHLDTPSKLQDFLDGSKDKFSSNEAAHLSSFQYEVLDSSFLHIKLNDLVVVRATNPFLQQMFYGQTTAALVNLKRLSEFANRTLRYEDVFTVPHVLG